MRRHLCYGAFLSKLRKLVGLIASQSSAVFVTTLVVLGVISAAELLGMVTVWNLHHNHYKPYALHVPESNKNRYQQLDM